MKVVLAALALLALLASLTPYARREAWWIRVLDFPRLQILVFALGILTVGLWSLDPQEAAGLLVLLAAGGAALIQGAHVLPYTPLARREVLDDTSGDAQTRVALLVANVRMSNRDAARLTDIIAAHEPDIVLLLEPDDWWEHAMRPLEGRGYAHVVRRPLGNRYGMLLYSRLPLREAEVRYLLKAEIPSIRAQVQLRSGAWVAFHALHPEPPSPTEADSSLPRDAELLVVAREVKDNARPTIVAGDLNDVAWSYTTTLFQKISRLLDPRKGRGMYNTFHAKVPLLRWPLDHVFHSDHFLLTKIERLPAFGSDHFPVYIALTLQPDAEARQEAPRPDADDARQAADKLERR